MLRRIASKPRGLLRDATLVLGLIVLNPDIRYLTAGTAILLIGVALHFWSKGALVRNWTVTTKGPYRVVRHPFYLACFVIDMGICCMSGQPWLGALYVVAFPLVYLPTIRKEEHELTAMHGAAYSMYVKAVPAKLVPYRLRAIIGPLDFALANLIREKEFGRALRILAIPSYFVIVGAIFHANFIGRESNRILALVLSIAWAISLNVSAAVLRRHERAAISV